MNAILDIIIVVIASLTIYFAARNGFVKTLLSASSFLIALVITVTLFSPVKNAFMETSAGNSIREHVETALDSIMSENNADNSADIDALLEKESGADGFFEILDNAGIKREDLQKRIDEWKTEEGADLKEKLIDYIAAPIVNALITALVVCLLFFGSLILLKIVTCILDKILKLPVLKTANTLLGVILGIILALVRIYLFVALVKILLPYGQTLDIGAFDAINTEKTLLFKLFYDFNIFNFLV